MPSSMISSVGPPQLHPRLLTFLDLVWTHRNWTVPAFTRAHATGPLPADASGPDAPRVDIYGLYNRIYRHQTSDVSVDPARMVGFLINLKSLAGQLVVQGAEWEDSDPDDLLRRSEQDHRLLGELATCFFHFRHPSFHAMAIDERIYLNARPEWSISVMRFVTHLMMHAPAAVRIASAKVAAPPDTRRDRIVIYTANEASRELTLDHIARFQNGRVNGHPGSPQYFNTDPPSMTRPIFGRTVGGQDLPLVGVGTGKEPPRGSGHSFGTLRAAVIQLALNDAYRGDRTKAGFLAAVQVRLRQQGIDPMRPELNLAP